jgi:hypothetical protein
MIKIPIKNKIHPTFFPLKNKKIPINKTKKTQWFLPLKNTKIAQKNTKLPLKNTKIVPKF